MRVTLAALLILLATSAIHAAVPGQTLLNGASPALSKDVLHLLTMYESALAPKCKLTVVDTQVIETPQTVGIERATDLANAHWTERWTLNRCGSNVTYSIKFNAQGSRGTDIGARLENPGRTNAVEQIQVK